MPSLTIKTLPAAVREALIDDSLIEANKKLQRDFSLSDQQLDYVLDSTIDIVLQKRAVLEFPNHVAKIPNGKNIDLRALALRATIDYLWPLQEYLGNVDILITRLGGRVPPPKPLPQISEEEVKAEETWTAGAAKDVLQRFKQFNELYLSHKPIRDVSGRLKTPSAANWLADYLHTMGAEGVSSLKRSQYIAKSLNAQKLNDAEKRNLLNFFMSYESGLSMYWRVAEGQFLLVEPELPKEAQSTDAQRASVSEMSELIGYYTNIQKNYRKLFDERKPGLDMEVAGNAKKLVDIAWDALGLADAERCMTAFDLLIDRHLLLDALKSDQRFRGIVGRHIGVRYGIEAKTFWNGDLTTALALALFWKLILFEKLGLEEGRAAIVAHHFTKKLGYRESPMYLDLKTGKFLFREIAYTDRQFTFNY